MGEVVQFRPRGEKKKEIQKKTIESIPKLPKVEECDQLDYIKLTSFLEILTSVIKNIPKGVKSTDIYRKHYMTVSEYTDDEIIGWIHNAKAPDINSMPVFFVAIVEVAKQRGIIFQPE